MQLVISDQLNALNNHLSHIQRELNGDLTPLMDLIGSALRDSTKKRFNTKKDPSGVSWAQLKPSTVKSKNGNPNILVASGDLSNVLYEVTRQSVAVGTDRHYGKYHQTGTRDMPARKFLGLSVEDRSNIDARVIEFLEEVVNG